MPLKLTYLLHTHVQSVHRKARLFPGKVIFKEHYEPYRGLGAL